MSCAHPMKSKSHHSGALCRHQYNLVMNEYGNNHVIMRLCVRTYAQAVMGGPQPLTWPLAYGLTQEARKDLGHRNIPEKTKKRAQAIPTITNKTAHEQPKTPQVQSLGCLNPAWEDGKVPTCPMSGTMSMHCYIRNVTCMSNQEYK